LYQHEGATKHSLQLLSHDSNPLETSFVVLLVLPVAFHLTFVR
jgi:hypothetical protein